MATNILIADDEPAVRRLCEYVLKSKGFNVDSVADGQAALEAVTTTLYDVVLLDINMPGLDGLTVLEHIATRHIQVSVIMITGFATLEAAVEAQELGSEGFLLKPFDDQQLVTMVHRVAERRAVRQRYAQLQTQIPLIRLYYHLITATTLESLAQMSLQIIIGEIRASDASLWLEPFPRTARHAHEFDLLAHLGRPVPLAVDILQPADANDDNNEPVRLVLTSDGTPTQTPAQANAVHVQLRTETRPIGVMSFTCSPNTLTYQTLNFLTLASSYLSFSLESLQLYRTIDQARQKWEAIFDTFNDGLLIHTVHDGTITQANQTMAAWLNTTVAALKQQTSTQILVDAHGTSLHDLLPPADQPFPATIEFTAPPWAPERAFRVRQFLLSSMLDASPEIIHIVEDMTDATKMQAKMLQTEKLSALGRLSASLAHEINNPLQALRSGLRLLGRPTLSDEKRQQYVATLSTEVERLINLTSRTLDFARPASVGRTAADINALVKATLHLVRKQLQHSRIEVSLQLAASLPPVSVIADQIKQVILNLILNAIDAMPDGGQLQLRTAYQPHPPHIIISVGDEGGGMPPAVLAKIYEPFFSTKEAGTGLGLAISYSIVTAHGGHLEVESQPDQGTCFIVYLPVYLPVYVDAA